MVNLSLNDQEVDVLRKSISNCIKSCHEGGPTEGCPNCHALQGVMSKL